MPKNWEHKAGLLWPTLIEAALDRRLLRYKNDLAPIIGEHHRNVRLALGPIQDFCMANNHPPLTAVVVGTSGHPGEGFIAWDIDDFETARDVVAEYRWRSIENPYAAFGPDITENSLVQRLVDDPDSADDVFCLVRNRGNVQRVFRKALLRAYDSQCAFCGLTFENALEGAHIVPWGQCHRIHKLDVRNGPLLCSTHHRLFDTGLFTLTKNWEIQYSDPEGRDGRYSDTDKAYSLALHGQRIKLPRDRRHWPDPAFTGRRLHSLAPVSSDDT